MNTANVKVAIRRTLPRYVNYGTKKEFRALLENFIGHLRAKVFLKFNFWRSNLESACKNASVCKCHKHGLENKISEKRPPYSPFMSDYASLVSPAQPDQPQEIRWSAVLSVGGANRD